MARLSKTSRPHAPEKLPELGVTLTLAGLFLLLFGDHHVGAVLAAAGAILNLIEVDDD